MNVFPCIDLTHNSSAVLKSVAVSSVSKWLWGFLHLLINIKTNAVTLNNLQSELYWVNFMIAEMPGVGTGWETLNKE